MYLQRKSGPVETKAAKCPKCGCRRLLVQRGGLKCTDCDHVITASLKGNKYGAKKTPFNGKVYDSKFEAGEAAKLELRKRAGDIIDYETQYKVEIDVYNERGVKVMTVKHKIDFRVHELDGTYTLLEAKGMELDDWKWRRKLLEAIWLPLHLDHKYEVVKQRTVRKKTIYGKS